MNSNDPGADAYLRKTRGQTVSNRVAIGLHTGIMGEHAVRFLKTTILECRECAMRRPGSHCWMVVVSLAFGAMCRATHPAYADEPTAAQTPAVTFKEHPTEIVGLAFSPDGSRITSTSSNSVRTWNATTGAEIGVVRVDDGGTIAVSRDLQRLAVARFPSVVLLDLTTGKDILSVDPHGAWDRNFPFRPMVAAIDISPDNRRLASAGSVTRVGGSHGLPGGFVVIWDVQTGQELHRFDRLSTRADAVTFGRDGKYVAAGTQGASGELPEPGEVRIWETESGRLRLSLNTRLEVKPGGDPCSVVKLAFDPEATRLAAALGDGTVRIWELPTAKVVVNQRGHEKAPTGQEIDPTGLILGPQRAIRCIVFNSDGSRLALGGYDRVVRVWDTGTGIEKHAFRFDVPRINAVVFSPDGKRLAAGGGDPRKSGEAAVWRVAAE
jgi:WD40 repeat protein